MVDDPLAAALAKIRERAAEHADPKIMDAYRGWCASKSADDVPSLLAAVDAALKLAGDWEQAAKRLDDMAERADARGADPMRVTQVSADAQAHRDHAAALTEAIARELTGKET